MDYAIKVDNITKQYDNLIGQKAVDNVSFKVNKGEWVAVVGASGSGKSTLLRIVGLLDTQTMGTRMYCGGMLVDDYKEKEISVFRRQNIGFVHQFFNLIPILKVSENILLPLALDNKKPDENYYNQLIKAFGIENVLDKFPNHLSGGELQRVAVARALINKPTILIADEPTGNLDVKNTENLIKQLKLSNVIFGQTIIMVTHDLNLAKNCDRIITLSDGKIISDIQTEVKR